MPRRENVAFFATGDQATKAGYRPCKRCKPTEIAAGESVVVTACRLLAAHEPIGTERVAQEKWG